MRRWRVLCPARTCKRRRRRCEAVLSTEDQMRLMIKNVMGDARAWALLLALMTIGGAAGIAAPPTDEANAKSMLKAMSDYMAAQKAYSFDYDTYLEVVTK